MRSLVSSLLAALALVASPCIAQPPAAAANVLHGCVSRYTGVLRVVSAHGSCLSFERAVEWNIQGPPGSNGAAGPQGQTGPPGATGPAGPAGTGLLHVAYVPASGTPQQNGAALVAAVNGSSTQSISVLQLDAGTFTLPAASLSTVLELPSPLSIVGAGAGSTIIDVDASQPAPVIVLQHRTAISSLTLAANITLFPLPGSSTQILDIAGAPAVSMQHLAFMKIARSEMGLVAVPYGTAATLLEDSLTAIPVTGGNPFCVGSYVGGVVLKADCTQP